MPRSFGLPQLGMQPFGTAPQAPKPLSSNPMDNVTPEQLAQMLQPYDEQQAAIQKQMAYAQALRGQPVERHSTGIGGAFGALAAGLNGANGAMQQQQAQSASDILLKKRGAADAQKFGLMQALEAEKARKAEALKREEMAQKDRHSAAGVAAAAKKAADKKSEDLIAQETHLRDKYTADEQTKAMNATFSSFNQITKAPKTGTGDLSRIYGLAKLFDPSGRVTDSDAEMAASTGGLPGRVQGLFNEYTANGKLSDGSRAQIDDEAKRLTMERRNQFRTYQDSVRGVAKHYGIAPERVVVPMAFDAFGEPTQQAVSAAGVDLGKQRVTVSDGKETLEIDAADLADAQKDGFSVVR